MIAYTSTIPLRQSSVWGAFAEAVTIPHRYGEITGSLIQYSADRRQWVWADHASVGIDAVLVDGLPVQGWVWRNDLDSTGHAVTLVEFSEAPDASSALLARGRGKASTLGTGLITNPADVVHDLLTNICGRTVPDGALDTFRADCAALGIVIGGEIAGGSIQSAIRGLCDSVGAIFHPLHPGLCQIHPGPSSYARKTWEIDGRDTGQSVECDAALEDAVTEITAGYAVVDGQATATTRAFITDSTLPSIPFEMTLDWIQSEAVAYGIIARLLLHWARVKPWTYQIGPIDGIVLPGDMLTITHGLVPAATATVLRSEPDYAGNTTNVGSAQ